jgi:hypothetical protein
MLVKILRNPAPKLTEIREAQSTANSPIVPVPKNARAA